MLFLIFFSWVDAKGYQLKWFSEIFELLCTRNKKKKKIHFPFRIVSLLQILILVLFHRIAQRKNRNGQQYHQACFPVSLCKKKKKRTLKNPNPSFRGCCPSARFNRDSCDVPTRWKGQLQRWGGHLFLPYSLVIGRERAGQTKKGVGYLWCAYSHARVCVCGC